MGKLKNIIDGWKNLLVEDKEMQPLFDQRLATCKNCPGNNNKAGICILCGCVIKAKTHSPLEECPANYWEPVIYTDNDIEYILKSELPPSLQPYFDEEEVLHHEWLAFLLTNHKEEEVKLEDEP